MVNWVERHRSVSSALAGQEGKQAFKSRCITWTEEEGGREDGYGCLKLDHIDNGKTNSSISWRAWGRCMACHQCSVRYRFELDESKSGCPEFICYQSAEHATKPRFVRGRNVSERTKRYRTADQSVLRRVRKTNLKATTTSRNSAISQAVSDDSDAIWSQFIQSRVSQQSEAGKLRDDQFRLFRATLNENHVAALGLDLARHPVNPNAVVMMSNHMLQMARRALATKGVDGNGNHMLSADVILKLNKTNIALVSIALATKALNNIGLPTSESVIVALAWGDIDNTNTWLAVWNTLKTIFEDNDIRIFDKLFSVIIAPSLAGQQARDAFMSSHVQLHSDLRQVLFDIKKWPEEVTGGKQNMQFILSCVRFSALSCPTIPLFSIYWSTVMTELKECNLYNLVHYICTNLLTFVADNSCGEGGYWTASWWSGLARCPSGHTPATVHDALVKTNASMKRALPADIHKMSLPEVTLQVEMTMFSMLVDNGWLVSDQHGYKVVSELNGKPWPDMGLCSTNTKLLTDARRIAAPRTESEEDKRTRMPRASEFICHIENVHGTHLKSAVRPLSSQSCYTMCIERPKLKVEPDDHKKFMAMMNSVNQAEASRSIHEAGLTVIGRHGEQRLSSVLLRLILSSMCTVLVMPPNKHCHGRRFVCTCVSNANIVHCSIIVNLLFILGTTKTATSNDYKYYFTVMLRVHCTLSTDLFK